jgi:signal transduction histidine kinase
VTVDANPCKNGVEIRVIDTGIGIAPDDLTLIFEPFHQATQAERSRYSGVGLGLYIVRRMLELLDGTVSVESRVGHGSTFRVWVPRHDS